MGFFDSDIEELNFRIIHMFMNVFLDYIHTYIDLRYYFLDYIHIYVKVRNVRDVKNEYGEC